MIIKELTEKEKKEAVSFMEWIAQMTYEEFEQWKKENTWWSDLLLNWCRIRKDYPELNTIRETRFVLPDKQKKRARNKSLILAEMSRKKAQFFAENLIPEDEANAVDENKEKRIRFRIIHHTKLKDDESVMLAIPFDSINLMVPKFWASVEVYKSQCPEFFEEILNTYKKYDWTALCSSNAEKYNKRY